MYVLGVVLLLLGSISALPNPTQEPLLDPAKFGPSKESARTNANSIFNAIHSSMRQWGSSLQHNGMSLFLASIPQGVMLYHGTHTPERVKGIEWLAFEIEHAENFARSESRRPPAERPGGPGDRLPEERPPVHGPTSDMESDPSIRLMFHEDEGIQSLEDKPNAQGGYLHMYRTNRPINRLLYIDGMSAAKTKLGTLDTQDILLLNFTEDNSGRGMFRERERAEKLCEWGKKYHIEGYIRTEAGIEIIWCEFENGLDFVSHNQRPDMNSPESDNAIGLFEYYRAMSARYQSITASRVFLHYSSMVSAFFYPLNFTNPDRARTNLPRILFSKATELEVVKADLESVLAKENPSPGVDWQGVVDMIVSRYTNRLPFLATKATKTAFRSEINTLLNVFIDYNATGVTAAIPFCTWHYLRAASPSTAQDYLVQAALEEVSRHICEVLFDARALVLADEGNDEGSPPAEATRLLKGLMEWLDWSTWKECGACDYDQVCVVAIWPFGSVEDHVQPSCQNSSQITAGRREGGYW